MLGFGILGLGIAHVSTQHEIVPRIWVMGFEAHFGGFMFRGLANLLGQHEIVPRIWGLAFWAHDVR